MFLMEDLRQVYRCPTWYPIPIVPSCALCYHEFTRCGDMGTHHAKRGKRLWEHREGDEWGRSGSALRYTGMGF
jgi:hypothetical protein